LFAAVRNPGLFESLVVGSGATSPELAAGWLKDLIEALAGAFDSVERGEVAVQFVTQSAAVATPASVLEDYRLSSAGRRFAQAAVYVRAYPRDLPRLKALLPGIKTPVLVLAGRDDPIVPPSNGELLAKHLPIAVMRDIRSGGCIPQRPAKPAWATGRQRRASSAWSKESTR